MTGLLRMRKFASGLLLVGILMMMTTVAATAAKGNWSEFSAEGVISGITPGDVRPAGNSGRFVVKDRTISGLLGGDLEGPFSFTYGTNVPIATQSGQIHGKASLADGAFEANVVAQSSLVAGPAIAVDLSISPPSGSRLPGAVVGIVVGVGFDGKLIFTSGTQGRGTIVGELWTFVSLEGHIIEVAPSGLLLLDPITYEFLDWTGVSGLEITGQWHE